MSENQQIPNEAVHAAAALPPRPITAVARRRVMNEPMPRFWLLLSALTVITLIGTTISGLMQWRTEASLITNGAAVKAIAFVDARIKGRPLPIGMPVNLEYEFNGKKYTPKGILTATGDGYMCGEPFDIRVDRDDPMIWTNRKTAGSLGEKMIGSGIMVVFTVATLLVTWMVRWMYLSLWRNGEQHTARVLEQRQNALAPRSVNLHCVVRIGKVDRAVAVCVPQDKAPAVGATLEVITNPSGSRAIAVNNYTA